MTIPRDRAAEAGPVVTTDGCELPRRDPAVWSLTVETAAAASGLDDEIRDYLADDALPPELVVNLHNTLDAVLVAVRDALSDVREQLRARPRWHADVRAADAQRAERAARVAAEHAAAEQARRAHRARIQAAHAAARRAAVVLEVDPIAHDVDRPDEPLWRLLTPDRRSRWLPPTIGPNAGIPPVVTRNGTPVYVIERARTLAEAEGWLTDAAHYVDDGGRP